jgi:hypothetical protein
MEPEEGRKEGRRGGGIKKKNRGRNIGGGDLIVIQA